MAKNQSTYTLKIDAELGNLQQILNQAKNSLSSFMASGNAPKGLEKAFEKINDLLGQISDKTGKPLDLKGLAATGKDLTSVQESFKTIIRLLGEFDDLSEDIKLSFLSGDEQKKIQAASKALSDYGKAMEEVAKKQKLLDTAQKTNAKDKSALDKAKKKVGSLQDDRTLAQARLTGAQTKLNAAKGLENANPKDIAKYEAEVTKLTAELGILDKNLNEANAELNTAQTAYNASAQSIKKMEAEIKRASGASLKQLKEEAIALGISLDGLNGHNAAKQVEILTDRLEEFKQEAMKGAKPAFDAIKQGCEKAENAVDGLQDELKEAVDATKQTDEAAAQRDAFEAKIKSFLGLSGAAQVLRVALRDAMQTITELDAVMGQMAVVTDLTVGDYWKQLPEYSERASKLGVSITEAYEAATLYYQQGLKANEVTALSEQTLKMAAIAGLDAADATDRMTAALRGFNMELNEANSQKIADVYSELAAITASDVDEISTAMTKTASIASSAGMEFETTAAFLSQIIETTRESAETAGTALKTVIARFQELKKSPSEIGEVEGEIVDANAIETALRSVGVALRDSSGQFRELDDVFLELSSKWDGLDKNTQRYIATIAAGSRQQSRFIAMMQDYARTQELVAAANTSAGASQKQFEKTTETLQFKVNQLKNAWHEFTMGIVNSQLVKTGVDILTKFLEIINKSTSALDGVGGSLTKIVGIVAIFNIGKALYEKVSGPISGFFIDKLPKMAYESGKLSAEQWEAGGKAGFTGEGGNKDNQKEGQKSTSKKKKVTARSKWSEAREHGNKKKKAQQELSGLEKDSDEYAKKNQEILDEGKKQWDAYGESIKLAGQAVSGAGVAMSVFGGILSSLGLEEAGEFFTKLGNGAMIAGTAISTIIPVITSIVGTLVAGGMATSLAWAWVTGIVLAVAALAVLVGVAINNAIKNSPEGKLKAAKKAADEAAEAADQAKEAYEGLSNSLDKLDDQYKALEELTKGTKEWNKAVLEVNSSVLDLIKDFPQLAQFVKNTDGVLRLDVDSEGVQEVLRKSYASTIHTANAQLAAEMRVQNAQTDVQRKNFKKENFLSYDYDIVQVSTGPRDYDPQLSEVGTYNKKTHTIKGAKYQLTDNQIDEIAKAFASGELSGKTDEQLKETINELSSFKDSLKLTDGQIQILKENIEASGDDILEYGQSLLNKDLQEQKYYDSMATSIVSLVDTMGMAEDRINQMFNIADGEVYKEAYDEAKSWFDDTDLNQKGKNWLDEFAESSGMTQEEAKAYVEEAMQANGYKDFQLNDDRRKLRASWTDAEGNFHTNEKVVQSTFKNVVATYYADQQVQKQAEYSDEYIEALLEKMPDDVKDAFNKALQNEQGDLLTSDDLKTLNGIDSIITNAFKEIPDYLKDIYDPQNVIDEINSATVGAGYLTESGWKNITSGAARALDKVYGVQKGSKYSDETTYQNEFNKIIAGLDEEGKELFSQTLASLSEGAENLESWDVAADKLKDLGEGVVEFVQKSAGLVNARYSSAYLKNMGVSEGLISQYETATDDELDNFHKTFKKWKQEYDVVNSEAKKAEHELITKTIDAIVESREKQIDAYEEAVNAEAEATNNLIAKISENVSRLRELREKDEREKEISQNLSKQAYLGMDTSGMNSLDILSLQEEEKQLVQDYEDQAVDDAIARLEEDNEKAIEQREKQIELMRDQLDVYKNSEQILLDAKEMIDNATEALLGDKDLKETGLGKLFDQGFISDYEESEFWNQLSIELSKLIPKSEGAGNGEDEDGKPKPPTDGESAALKGAKTTVKSAYDNYINGRSDYNTFQNAVSTAKTGLTTEEQGQLDSYINDQKKETTKNSGGTRGKASAEQFNNQKWDEIRVSVETSKGTTEFFWVTTYGKAPKNGEPHDSVVRKGSELEKAINNRLAMSEGITEDEITPSIGSVALYNNVPYIYRNVKNYDDAWVRVDNNPKSGTDEQYKELMDALQKSRKWQGFKTGGLADFTGPAWLDGTPSKPEYILNAKQTERFFSLIDVLEGYDANKGEQKPSGDNYFDININVEKLDNDYDVEQVADKIRRMIYEDATYRNVNAINHIR